MRKKARRRRKALMRREEGVARGWAAQGENVGHDRTYWDLTAKFKVDPRFLDVYATQ